MNPSKPAPAHRGRTPAAKPLATSSTASTASTRAKQATSSLKPSDGNTRPTKAAASAHGTDAKSKSTTSRSGSVNKPEPSASTSSAAKSPPSVVVEPSVEGSAPAPTSDSLQVAAQLYPWLYMTSTLEACFQTAEEAAKKDLAARSEQLAAAEAEISDQRTRFQAERAADFYDELSTDAFAETAPRIMQTFLSHGDACERVEAEALQLATHGAKSLDEDAPLQVYDEMLNSLEQLHAEAVELETSILKLTAIPESESGPGPEREPASGGDLAKEGASSASAREQIMGVFAACLPVLRARISNLLMAQELIDGAQENLSITLRMESLGLA
ncbi:hypothetical protein LshimejAT787_0110840 [Lyophyllum shimeji]|uniref:Uncharacterized protein n=1 Tax=Lyophyllum shimeji TaxID=47721 RepID=A0A9P3PDZ1_LYOSH|nr:hypothetical protein LshimejAT787_0110840 [Lyophyllum shimeji]